MYTSAGNPTAYQDLTVLQFVYRYLLVMDREAEDIKVRMSAHRKALMSDAQLYSWEHTRACYGVWLNQLEQGRCTLFDEEPKIQFRQTLI